MMLHFQHYMNLNAIFLIEDKLNKLIEIEKRFKKDERGNYFYNNINNYHNFI